MQAEELREMAGFEARFERLELKYLIDEFTADRVRRAIEPFCRSDEHNSTPRSETAQSGEPGYSICSLYLDTPGLAMFRAKERGDSERLKLRIRTYRDPNSAVVEIKRKVSYVINKRRAVVDRSQVEGIAAGRLPAGSSPDVADFLTDFAITTARSGAEPTLHVRYDREAYTSDVDTYARVTFDRRVEARRTRGWELDAPSDGWCSFDQLRRPNKPGQGVILELKCQSFVPWWIMELIRSQALKQQSISKYGIGIYLTSLQVGGSSAPPRSARALQ
jgi:hypothetical protein